MKSIKKLYNRLTEQIQTGQTIFEFIRNLNFFVFNKIKLFRFFFRYYPDQEVVFWTEDGDNEHKLCSIEVRSRHVSGV